MNNTADRTLQISLRLHLALLTCATLVACGGATTPDTPAPDMRPVLFICLDTVRADHLGFMGYERRPTTPTLDALAARSQVFEDVTAPACWTKPSVPSYMTGSFPATHGVYEGSARRAGELSTDVLDDQATTLAEAFSAAGYATAAFIRNGQLAPGFGLEQGFETYDQGPYDAAAITDKALAWLEQRDTGRPWFLYLHILDAHWPFDVPDEDLRRFASSEDISLVKDDDWHQLMDEVNHGERILTADEQEGVLDLYDSCLRYIDDHLARLVDHMSATGLLDEVVVCVVADHGEEFLEHGRFGHGHDLYENLTRVGWTLQVPGVPGARHSAPVSLIDVHPSLLSAAGALHGLGPDHESLATDRTRRPAAGSPLFSEHKTSGKYAQGLRVGDHKLVRTWTNSRVSALLEADSRWEAELDELATDGDLAATPPHAAQLKPRDDPPFDPAEIRGPLMERDGDRLRIAGLDVWMDAVTDIYGEAEERSALQPGTPVKAKARRVDGRLVATHVKVYGAETDGDPEIRGRITRRELDGDRGVIWLHELPVAFDEETVFKDVGDLSRVTRDDVAAILSGGAERAETGGMSVVYQLFDLGADPGELEPVERVTRLADGSERLREISEQLDMISRAAHGRSHWAGEGAGTLDPELLEELRALGYVR